MITVKTGQKDFDPADIEKLAQMLKDGMLGIIPTDTVYGIAALASDSGAVQKLLTVKRRRPDNPLPVQVAGTAGANRIAVADSPVATALIDRFWPGALTLVLRRRPGADLPFQAERYIGIRVPASGFCLALIEAAGPLVVPSANLPGEQAPVKPEDIDRAIRDSVDFLADAGACPGGTESSVARVNGGIEVLREGAISRDDILRAWDEAPP